MDDWDIESQVENKLSIFVFVLQIYGCNEFVIQVGPSENSFRCERRCSWIWWMILIRVFFRVFFRLQLPLRTFWGPYRAIFSIFCLIWQEIVFWYEKLKPISEKPKNVSFCSWNLFFNYDFFRVFFRFQLPDKSTFFLIPIFSPTYCVENQGFQHSNFQLPISHQFSIV